MGALVRAYHQHRFHSVSLFVVPFRKECIPLKWLLLPVSISVDIYIYSLLSLCLTFSPVTFIWILDFISLAVVKTHWLGISFRLVTPKYLSIFILEFNMHYVISCSRTHTHTLLVSVIFTSTFIWTIWFSCIVHTHEHVFFPVASSFSIQFVNSKKNKPRNKIIKEKKNTQNNLCSLTTWSRRKQLKNEKNEMTFQKGEKKKQQHHKDVNVWSAIFFSRTLQNAIRYRTNSSKWKITTFGEKRILYAANIKSNQIWCTWSVSAWLFKWTNQKKGRYKT